MSKKPKILFILKRRQTSGGWVGCSNLPASSGLFNSARFVVDMLQKHGFQADLVQVEDGNDIDRVVYNHRPDYVVLEAIWVPPCKFGELTRLHPLVRWIVRTHSETPFLAHEGMAMSWLTEYVRYPHVVIAPNSARATREFRLVVSIELGKEAAEKKVVYLPNFYPTGTKSNIKKTPNEYLDVGCFGAVRPMKNQLTQAVAAIDAAHRLHKKLRFHVNGTRIEQGGESVLKNINAIMEATGNQLVCEPWVDHEEFLQLLRKMDVGLQVSFSETFNIVAADMVTSNLPVVVSPEISWVSDPCQADPTSSKDIADTLVRVLDWEHEIELKVRNFHNLKHLSEEAEDRWTDYLKR